MCIDLSRRQAREAGSLLKMEETFQVSPYLVLDVAPGILVPIKQEIDPSLELYSASTLKTSNRLLETSRWYKDFLSCSYGHVNDVPAATLPRAMVARSRVHIHCPEPLRASCRREIS